MSRSHLPAPMPSPPCHCRWTRPSPRRSPGCATGPAPSGTACCRPRSRQQAVGRALDQVGDPYVWGATGPDSFDCSGLMWWSYDGVGIDLPRVSRDQSAGGGVPVAIEDLLPGDLVFFATAAWDPGVVHHVGMYVGDGLMVDAPAPGEYVRVEPVSGAGYAGAVRPVAAVKPARKHPAKGAGEAGDQPADTPRRTAVPLPTTAPATPTPGSAPSRCGAGGPVSAEHHPHPARRPRPRRRPTSAPTPTVTARRRRPRDPLAVVTAPGRRPSVTSAARRPRWPPC